MTLIEAIILGLVQGLTEFIPVSSSGHLIIAHRVLGISETGLTFDVALHLGTLLALIIFFHKDIWQLALSIFYKSAQTRLAWLLIIATLPAVIAGVLLEDLAENNFRSLRLVAFNLIAVGVLMILAERYAAKKSLTSKLDDISPRQAMGMGLAQAIALVPGVSRSGSTITAGIFGGLTRTVAARFSFLLAIPITFGALIKVVFSDNTLAHIGNEKAVFAAGIVTALISGLIAIRFLLRFVARHPLNVFAYYRFAIGGAVLMLSFIL